MAESNITKQALANGLKELMAVQSFEKISVGQICDKCHMSRQSFYYHFRDKYDLLNWICDEDFAPVFLISDEENRWIVIEEICRIFYKNKPFYQCALQINGQNSMTDHIREIMIPALSVRLKDILQQQNLLDTGSLLMIAPLLILFLFAQRNFVQGIERSGLVG